MINDEDFEKEFESAPVVVASQLRAGHTLTEEDVKAIQSVISELDSRENNAFQAFDDGRAFALKEVGGEELVAAVKMKDEERIARLVRSHMDKLFPKHQRTMQ